LNKSKEFLLNEKIYIENLLNSYNKKDIEDKGFSRTDIITMLSIYYKEKFSTIEELYNQINSDMLKFQFDDYYSEKFYKIIMSKCKYSLQKDLKLKELDYIPIYESEINRIKECQNDNDKKLLFTIYVLAKYNDFNGWTNGKIKLNDYSRLANVRCSNQDRNLLFYNLTQEKFIQQSYKISKFIYHVDLNENSNEKIVLKVTSIKNLGNQLMSYLKDGYKQCTNCGKLIKIKSNRQIYCDDCYKKINESDAKNRMKKMREKENVTF
jgi:DNA-directed RNA polymerase subunit RPC12/RpoP